MNSKGINKTRQNNMLKNVLKNDHWSSLMFLSQKAPYPTHSSS